MRDMKHLLYLDGKPIEYTLERKRVKNINLRVRGGEIYVSAARWVPRSVIERFLLSRGERLLRAAEQSVQKDARRWVSGERLLYLGREVALRIEQGGRPSVSLSGGELLVRLRESDDPGRVERAVSKWYRAESERLCRAACDRLYPHFAPLGVPRPEIRMRAMRSCWGNCRPERAVVTFNALLAAVPEEDIEYVAAHELTHFLHADHSPAFYAALGRVIPDWKARRAALEPLLGCTLCACCAAECPSVLRNTSSFPGPAAALHALRFIADSRDAAATTRLNRLDAPQRLFLCRSAANCTAACPAGLNPARAIARLRQMLARRVL